MSKNEEKRGRGRPKKNKSKRIVSIQQEDDMSSDENLILKLNVSDTESETENKKHTMVSLSSKYYSDTESEEFSEDSDSDSDVDSSGEESSSGEEDDKKIIKELKRKVREQDEIIHNLKKKLNVVKYTENTNSGVKEVAIVKPIDMKLFNKDTDKIIVVEKTNMPCWWCFHKFTSLPWFLPDYCNTGKYYIFGCFCSPNCASAYNDDLNDSKVDIRRVLLKKYYREITKTSENTDIISSPARELLLSGAMTIEEFRDKNLIIKKDYKTKIPPVMPLVLCVEIHNKK